MGENSPSLVAAVERTVRRAKAKNAGTKEPKEPLEAPRVLFVVPDASALPAGALKAQGVLSAEGYDSTWLTPAEVLDGKVLATPDVVVLDGGLLSLGTLCLHLKSEKQDSLRGALDTAAPVVILVSEGADMDALTRSGADEFIVADSSELEIKARFASAVRLARLKRELQATNEHLSHQIQVDDLTQVLNRRFFFQAAYRECSRARRYGQALSCLMVDVDHFSLYNTTFGYVCGDALLREVANILKTCVRDTDLVARFGGSKFVVLLTHTDVEGAGMVRDKIEKLVGGNYFVWHHQQLPVTVSIGEAERIPGRSQSLGGNDVDGDDNHPLSTREDLAELLEDADSALFVAKKGARFPSFLEKFSSPSS